MLDRRIKFRHIECVTAIARLGSLKAACTELHLTQPALSKTLKELEDILGARLMMRDRGGVTLTPEGKVFLEFAGQSLAALRRAVDGVSSLQKGGRETLRIGTLPSVAARLLPEAVVLFRTLAPNTHLSLKEGPHSALTRDLRTGGLDMVIGRMGAPGQMQGISFTQLYQERVVCVAAPDHPLAGQPSLAPQVLTDWPILYPPEGAAIRSLLDRWSMAQGLHEFRDTIECVSGAFGRNFIRQSQALWFISEGVVAKDLAERRLVALDLDLALTDGPVGLMTRPGDALSNSAQILTHALIEVAKAQSIS